MAEEVKIIPTKKSGWVSWLIFGALLAVIALLTWVGAKQALIWKIGKVQDSKPSLPSALKPSKDVLKKMTIMQLWNLLRAIQQVTYAPSMPKAPVAYNSDGTQVLENAI